MTLYVLLLLIIGSQSQLVNFIFLEGIHGSFQHSFQLPSSIKADKIKADFEKGILKVTLPKVEEAKKKEVKIKVKTGKTGKSTK